jgi:hypothetical protein
MDSRQLKDHLVRFLQKELERHREKLEKILPDAETNLERGAIQACRMYLRELDQMKL